MSSSLVALVTGASSGIGLATALALRQRSWTVVGLDRQPPTAAAVDDFRHVDVRDEPAVREAVSAAAAAHGGVDATICCAGISGSSAGDGPIDTVTGPAFDAVVGVNLRGAFLTAAAAWPHLVARRGNLVFVSSVLGLTGGGGPFRSSAYVVSKGGLVALTRTLAAQGRDVGVRANCVAPGLVDTPLAARATGSPQIRRYVSDRQAVTGGPLSPDDVAAAVVYLASPSGRAVTGQVVTVDAGWTLDPPWTPEDPA